MRGECHESRKILLQRSVDIIILVRSEFKVLFKLSKKLGKETSKVTKVLTRLEQILLITQRFVLLVAQFR